MKAALYFLHVIDLPASVQLAQGLGFTELATPSKEDAQTVLALLGERYGIPVEHQSVEIGSIKEHIFDTVDRWDCQLLIIGDHSSTGLASRLGSTTYSIVNHATCDVLILK